jgi:arylsulfatase
MSQPNILLIFTDQQRFDTIEAHGNPIIRTPALNRLVEQGVSFTRAYTPCPVCVPARYSMMTGLLPHRTGCFDNQPTAEGRSMMQILSEAGYQTHGVGKMHFNFADKDNLAELWGFDSRDTSEEIGTMDDFRATLDDAGYEHVYDPHGVRSDMYYIPQPSQLPAKLHHTTWVADRSLAFMQKRDRDRPFFLMSSFIKPHPPFETPTPWNKLYRGPEMPLPKRPDGYENLTAFWNKFQNRYKYRDQGIDDNLIRTMTAAYYSAISFIDYQLGRLFEYMDNEQLMENTVIIYSSDHGELLGDYDSFGKRCFLDSAARIPMIISYPGCKQGSTCKIPVSLVDILPTCIDAAGVHRTENYSGESLIDIETGASRRELIFGQFQSGEYGLYMAVSEQFKYIYSAPDHKEWLFDLVTDPLELRNKANNALYKQKTDEMRARLTGFLKAEGYEEPLAGDGWKAYPVKRMPDDPDAHLLFQDTPQSIPKIPGYERDISSMKHYNGGEFKPRN